MNGQYRPRTTSGCCGCWWRHRGTEGRHLPRDVARPRPQDECPGRAAVSARSGRHGLRVRAGTMNPDPIRDADTDLPDDGDGTTAAGSRRHCGATPRW